MLLPAGKTTTIYSKSSSKARPTPNVKHEKKSPKKRKKDQVSIQTTDYNSGKSLKVPFCVCKLVQLCFLTPHLKRAIFRCYYASLQEVKFICPSICPSVHPSLRPSIHRFIHPSVHLSLRPSIPPSIHPSIHPSVRPSVSPSICPSLYPSVGLVCRSVGHILFLNNEYSDFLRGETFDYQHGQQNQQQLLMIDDEVAVPNVPPLYLLPFLFIFQIPISPQRRKGGENRHLAPMVYMLFPLKTK